MRFASESSPSLQPRPVTTGSEDTSGVTEPGRRDPGLPAVLTREGVGPRARGAPAGGVGPASMSLPGARRVDEASRRSLLCIQAREWGGGGGGREREE